MTLVIMAAGMGSRYGGLKQVEPVGPNGSFILDYSVYDARLAGFDRVVFVIKEENFQLFRDTIGKRLENQIDTAYAFQKLSLLPKGIPVPPDRVKPWGTAHAVLCLKGLVKDNFAVINADDFYGRESFFLLSDFLGAMAEAQDKLHFAMAGYILEHTLTDQGTVSRGVCQIDGDHYLSSITERTKIKRSNSQIQYEEKGRWITLPPDTIVSMNCWGFSPAVMDEISIAFEKFIKAHLTDRKSCEFFLPSVIQELMSQEKCDVKVLDTMAKWYGITYAEDKEALSGQIRRMTEEGLYPEGLFC